MISTAIGDLSIGVRLRHGVLETRRRSERDGLLRRWRREYLVSHGKRGVEPLHWVAVEEATGSDPVGRDAASGRHPT